jgi:hypothetical protein
MYTLEFQQSTEGFERSALEAKATLDDALTQ